MRAVANRSKSGAQQRFLRLRRGLRPERCAARRSPTSVVWPNSSEMMSTAGSGGSEFSSRFMWPPNVPLTARVTR